MERWLHFGVSTRGGPLATAELEAVADAVGEHPSFVLWYEDFAAAAPVVGLRSVRDYGAHPIVTWEPRVWRTDVANRSAEIFEGITAGRYDDYLRSWSAVLRGVDGEVYLRFAHEFNGSWYPWTPAVGVSAELYVATWRRIHDVFSREGAVGVRWVWSPAAGDGGGSPLADWYPGPDCVDVLGVDGYNWGLSQLWSRWQSPAEIFADIFAELRAIDGDKPILVTEVACAEAGGSKPEWIAALVTMLVDEPAVSGFVWFHHDKETDWRLTSTPTSATAMAAALRAMRS